MNQVIEQIYRDHRQGLFSLALSITGSHHLAEDAVHNAFARLFGSHTSNSKLPGLLADSTGSVDSELPAGETVAYVYKTVRNCAIDTIRSNKRRTNLSESLFKESKVPGAVTDSTQDTLILQERTTILQKAIDELEEFEKEAVILKAMAGLTFDQAGVVANTSPKTIATRYRRALQKLEQKLKGQL